ncbi:sce7726 family protein [Helicobacter ibis]|uniref:Sce7726 family protein n=1 Tax=Helicobacter ibis TaxID=2962633 RepID=A0ABT4VES4_9HELI|nr:sce7726 family protein [Helicobacter ibis]MDA3969102.1 sce7726 family protein [Helicobacter ibis]
MEEKRIKCLFLQELIKKQQELLLASIEVPVIRGKRKFDILTIEKDNIIGYEIKSCKDNLAKLNDQIQDYLKICDRVYVILDQKFINSNLELPCNVGVIIFYNQSGKFIFKKMAKKNTPLAYYQTFLITQNKIKEYRKNSKQNSFEIRHHIVKKLKKNDLKEIVINELKYRFLENFLLLKHEIKKNSNTIHLDDLFLLSGKTSIKDKI